MADASEDLLTSGAPPTTNPNADFDADDDVPDFRFLSLAASAAAAGQKIPSRGIKDFEPHGTQLQQSVLQASRAAMHAVLSEERTHQRTVERAVWDPVEGGAWQNRVAGRWATSVGQMRKRPRKQSEEDNQENANAGDGQADAKTKTKGVHPELYLLPEEALWLVERGTLDLRWPAQEGEGEDDGLPMSIQAAHACFIGGDANTWLTLEKYIVYQYLKRAGYVVLRAQDNWKNVPDVVGTEPAEQPWSVWKWLMSESESSIQARQTSGPLVRPGLYTDYSSMYQKLALIPYHKTQAIKTLTPPTTDGPSVTWHVYKPNAHYKKSDPGPPEFYISVMNARDNLIPSEEHIDLLLRQTPYRPYKQGSSLYHKLRTGVRNVLLAVVDSGTTSFLSVADAGFGNQKLHEQPSSRGRGSKRGGFRGRGRGRGGRR